MVLAAHVPAHATGPTPTTISTNTPRTVLPPSETPTHLESASAFLRRRQVSWRRVLHLSHANRFEPDRLHQLQARLARRTTERSTTVQIHSYVLERKRIY